MNALVVWWKCMLHQRSVCILVSFCFLWSWPPLTVTYVLLDSLIFALHLLPPGWQCLWRPRSADAESRQACEPVDDFHERVCTGCYLWSLALVVAAGTAPWHHSSCQQLSVPVYYATRAQRLGVFAPILCAQRVHHPRIRYVRGRVKSKSATTTIDKRWMPIRIMQ